MRNKCKSKFSNKQQHVGYDESILFESFQFPITRSHKRFDLHFFAFASTHSFSIGTSLTLLHIKRWRSSAMMMMMTTAHCQYYIYDSKRRYHKMLISLWIYLLNRISNTTRVMYLCWFASHNQRNRSSSSKILMSLPHIIIILSHFFFFCLFFLCSSTRHIS